MSIKMINCYLTNRDTLSPVKGMVEKLIQCDDVRRVIILDCGSTYPPLLEWYDSQSQAEVIRHENIGNRVTWDRPNAILGEPGDRFYFASDADLDISQVPNDFLLRLQDGLNRYPKAVKAGLSLRLDDLDPAEPFFDRIHSYEDKYWTKQIDDHFYDADIDTVLAMYRTGEGWGGYGPALRSTAPYVARHLPWYLTTENITDEWIYYFKHLKQDGILWGPLLRDRFLS